MDIENNVKFLIYDANQIGLDFINLKADIENLNISKEVLIWSTMESDLPGGNEKYDFEKLNTLCESYNIFVNIVFGVLNQEYYNNINFYKNIKLHFWPTYLLNYTYNKLNNHNGIEIEKLRKNQFFNKLFVSYNNKPHSHRCRLIDKLHMNGLFDFGEISWNNLNQTNYDFESWEEKILKLDDFNDMSIIGSNHLINNTSFISLVSESSENLAFITEKTYKPILIGQPFLCLGGKLQNIILKDLGFVLYDEIFDYTFDYMDDINQRIDGVINNLLKIKNMNYFGLYKRIEDKVKHNKEVAISIVKNNLFIPDVIKKNEIPFQS